MDKKSDIEIVKISHIEAAVNNCLLQQWLRSNKVVVNKMINLMHNVNPFNVLYGFDLVKNCQHFTLADVVQANGCINYFAISNAIDLFHDVVSRELHHALAVKPRNQTWLHQLFDNDPLLVGDAYIHQQLDRIKAWHDYAKNALVSTALDLPQMDINDPKVVYKAGDRKFGVLLEFLRDNILFEEQMYTFMEIVVSLRANKAATVFDNDLQCQILHLGEMTASNVFERFYACVERF